MERKEMILAHVCMFGVIFFSPSCMLLSSVHLLPSPAVAIMIACYTLRVRGSEIPVSMLGDVLEFGAEEEKSNS